MPGCSRTVSPRRSARLTTPAGAAWASPGTSGTARTRAPPRSRGHDRAGRVSAETRPAGWAELEAGHVGLLGADGLGGGAQRGQLGFGQVTLDNAAHTLL